jgi:hypothetical protein
LDELATTELREQETVVVEVFAVTERVKVPEDAGLYLLPE